MNDEMEKPQAEPPVLPTRISHKHWPSLIWLVPLVALGVGLSLVVQSWLQSGPHIVIDFPNADGLRPGKTELRYKDVVVGHVDAVSLSNDHERVHVSVQLDHAMDHIAAADSRFWVVRPRISTAGISGLETLISGAYIAVDEGVAKERRKLFTGLEMPPFDLRGEPGRGFVLHTQDLGSLDVGAPIYYRRTRVGRVMGYTLDTAIDELLVQIFIEAPYDHLVNPQTRFWNASGLDLTLNANGIRLNTQSLASVLIGGIAFERPDNTASVAPAPAGQRFKLFTTRQAALAPLDGPPVPVRMQFSRSIRGLSVGAPVDIKGIEIGSVTAIRLDHNSSLRRSQVEVEAEIFPTRFGSSPSEATQGIHMLKKMIASGLQAQARNGNLLTGQLFVALDYSPAPPRASPDPNGTTLTIPTVETTSLSDLQPQIAEIVGKINQVPFAAIGQNLNHTLTQARSAIAQLTPEAQKTLVDVQRTLGSVQESLRQIDRNVLDSNAPLQRNVGQTLTELQRAAQSLRILTDYLQLHPESLLRGKPADAPLASPEGAR